ncbi:MAG: hypothetical protein NTX56_19260, partial [Proteobacteria bacterium]|nr:hypothetical protein [Pseudomonadota bacterium]
GAVENLGDAADVSAEHWVRALGRAIEQPGRMQAMANCARRVMAGRQAALGELEQTLVDGLY